MNITCKHCGKLLFVKESGNWGDPSTYTILSFSSGVLEAECKPSCKVPSPTITMTPPDATKS